MSMATWSVTRLNRLTFPSAKQVEERLRESEERYRDLVENSHELTYTHDMHGRLLSVNHTAALTLGYTATSLVGRNLGELLASEHRPQFEDYLGKIRRKVSETGTWVLQSVNGDRRLWEYHSMMRSDAKQGPYVRGMAHDITERTLAEVALRDSEERFHKIFEEGPIGMVLTSRDMNFFNANPAFCRMLGYTAAEMNTRTFLDVTHPENREQDRQNVDKLWRGEIPAYRTEKRYIAKNGDVRWGSLSASLIREQTGEPLYVLAMVEDISERKRVEIERQTLLEIMHGLAIAENLQEYLQFVHQAVAKVIYAENFFVILKNKSSGLFEEVYSVDKYDTPAPPSLLEKSICAYVFRSGKALLINERLFIELAARGEVELVGVNSKSWLGVPLITSRETIGVMAVQDYDCDDRFSEHDQEFLASIAGQVAQMVERKKAQETLAAERNLFRTLIDNLPDAVYAKDLESRFLLGNNALAQIMGAPTPDALIGKTDQEYYPKEISTLYLTNEQAILQSGRADINREEPIIYPDGSRGWMLTTKVPLCDQNGSIMGLVGIGRTITERKLREERMIKLHQLKEKMIGRGSSTEKLQQITDGVAEIFDAYFSRIWVLGTGDLCDKGCIHASVRKGPDVCRNRTQCLHLTVSSGKYSRTDGSHRRVPLGAYKIGRVAVGTEPYFVTNDVAHDARVHDQTWAKEQGLVSFAGFRLLSPLGKPIGVLALFKKQAINLEEERYLADLANTASQVVITGLTEAAQQRKRGTHYRNLVETQSDIIARSDLSGKLTFVNDAYCRIFGKTHKELLGNDFFSTVLPEDLPLTLAALEAIKEPPYRKQTETRHTTTKGIRWFSWENSTVLDEAGNPVELQGVGRDITERKQTEQALS